METELPLSTGTDSSYPSFPSSMVGFKSLVVGLVSFIYDYPLHLKFLLCSLHVRGE